MAGKELVSDDTATRIGAGLGALFGLGVGALAGLLVAGPDKDPRGDPHHGSGLIIIGSALGAVTGAYLGVPSGTCLSPEKATVGSVGGLLHNPRFP